MSVDPDSDPDRDVDPLRQAAPAVDDVDARRARALIEGRLFSGNAQPVRVGRYQIQGRIGSGGMGVVYRAHDPELVRDIAIKLMHGNATDHNDPGMARARLVREARAMARLAHPNVIHVYDVGTTNDGVFIAMELVEGGNLAQWIEESSLSWREILRLYVEAGRGLAAAHAAGVVHRDFKPENILRGTDGRIRVGDFGLAGGPVALEQSSQDSTIDRQTGSLYGPSGTLTKTGALLGTPKYMAPEQESSPGAGAQSDQFSFCVALYEALYGHPPFAGDTVAEYRREVQRGQIRSPPPDTRVRSWVHAQIVRGLAVDPAARHSALDPLLDQLEEALVDPTIARQRARRMRNLAITGGVVGLLVTGIAALSINSRQGPIPAVEATPTVTAPLPPPTAASGTPAAPQTRIASVDHPPAPADDSSAGATGPTSAPKSTAAVPPVESERVPPKRRRSADVCYFQQDKFKYLRRSRRHTRYIEDRSGRCYDCSEKAPSYRRALLRPNDCAQYFLCIPAAPQACADETTSPSDGSSSR